MGVSADSGNIDLAAAVAGGPGFAQRLTELATAKAAYDKSLNDLNLGKAALAARDEAGRALSAAKEKRDADMAALDAEVAQARSELNQWVENTRAETIATLNAAKSAFDDAQAQREAASLANQSAQSVLKQAQAEAATILKDSASQAADIVLAGQAKADKLIKDAEKTNKAAKAAMDEALAEKARYEAAIAAIKNSVPA